MSETNAVTGDDAEPGVYEIRIKGHLPDRWAAGFAGLTLTREDDGATLFRGPLVDQAALYGLLRKLRDCGLPLISVNRIASRRPPEPDVAP
jgi:hypothetical protein